MCTHTHAAANPHLADAQLRGGAPPGGYTAAAGASLAAGRVAVAFIDDPLRAVVERLAAPGVRRLVVVDRASRRVLGLVSLSDVAAYLFL
jgi:CBS domain-containing protein